MPAVISLTIENEMTIVFPARPASVMVAATMLSSSRAASARASLFARRALMYSSRSRADALAVPNAPSPTSVATARTAFWIAVVTPRQVRRFISAAASAPLVFSISRSPSLPCSRASFTCDSVSRSAIPRRVR